LPRENRPAKSKSGVTEIKTGLSRSKQG